MYRITWHHKRFLLAFSVFNAERCAAGSSDVYRFLALMNESPKRILLRSEYFVDFTILTHSFDVPISVTYGRLCRDCPQHSLPMVNCQAIPVFCVLAFHCNNSAFIAYAPLSLPLTDYPVSRASPTDLRVPKPLESERSLQQCPLLR